MPQVSFCLGSPAVTTCCIVFECFRRVFFYLHRVGGLVFGLLGPVLVAPLWFAVVPWGPRWLVLLSRGLRLAGEGCACRGWSLRWGRRLVLVGVKAQQIGGCFANWCNI